MSDAPFQGTVGSGLTQKNGKDLEKNYCK